ncbi:hypothetical protein PV10_00593 [Exophiala mesophila]|uniref:Uncharacterized protein n=1 Tax=Exophiala mesophila TaxID=212818 RepID=A0A0D1ZQ79_EXOME|nr:uncharacterized protein PV10_00593 [Exophiala mesophila]KIV96772.1 hypothetical protein PV10_00593 [Exophiala mesophila]
MFIDTTEQPRGIHPSNSLTGPWSAHGRNQSARLSLFCQEDMMPISGLTCVRGIPSGACPTIDPAYHCFHSQILSSIPTNTSNKSKLESVTFSQWLLVVFSKQLPCSMR